MKNKKFTSDSITYNTMQESKWHDIKRKPQSLDPPDDFSEYTVKNFPGYKTQQ